MSNSDIINNFQDYLNLYSNLIFKNKVSAAYESVIKSIGASDVNDFRILSNMLGINYVADNYNIEPSLGIFYSFWNNSNNVAKCRNLLQTYLRNTSGNENSNQTTLFINGNYLVTFILSFFFSNTLYDVKGNSLSVPPNLLNPDKISPAILNIKNFLQDETSSTSNNLQGCGNYSILSNLKDTYLLEANIGFIYYMCQDLYSKFQEENNDLTGEKLINNYRHQVSQNTYLLSYCGCFVPTPPLFHKKIPGFSEDPGGSTCDPLCYNNSVFKLYDNQFTPNGGSTGGGVPKTCNATICVIDNLSINSLNSNGKINFNQSCKGCNENNSTCLCFIDVTNNEIFEKISSGNNGMMTQENYNQNCPDDSVCFEYNDGEIREVECNKINTPRTGGLFDTFNNGLTKITSPKEIPQFFWFFMAIIFILLILFMYGLASYNLF